MLPSAIYVKYKRKPDFNHCPRCNQPVRWKYDGLYWVMCDPAPIYYKQTERGRRRVFKKGELVEGCELYHDGKNILEYQRGLVPHLYVCGKIRN